METGYQKLNSSALRAFTKALEANPAGDMEEVLRQVYTSYSQLRSQVDARRGRRRQRDKERQLDRVDLEPAPVLNRRAAVPLPLLSTLRSSIGTSSHIISPLSPQLLESLSIRKKATAPEVAELLLGILSTRQPLAFSGQRVIVPLSETMVVKLGRNFGTDELTFLHFLHDRVPAVIAPRALGFMTIGSVSCMFMTLLRGETLKARWPTMRLQEKIAVRAILDNMLVDLRKVHLPTGTQMGSLSDEHRCKDCRREVRVSAVPIYTEAQFNDFITSSETSHASAGYRRWVLSMMPQDHHVVLTHGDLHPGNIIVDSDVEGRLSLGIIDWEMGGFYPEYWEMLKAMNTRGVDDTSDWWEFLPPSIMGYNYNLVLDRLVETTLLR